MDSRDNPISTALLLCCCRCLSGSLCPLSFPQGSTFRQGTSYQRASLQVSESCCYLCSRTLQRISQMVNLKHILRSTFPQDSFLEHLILVGSIGLVRTFLLLHHSIWGAKLCCFLSSRSPRHTALQASLLRSRYRRIQLCMQGNLSQRSALSTYCR